MSARDFIKNSVLNADIYNSTDVGKIIVSMCVAFFLGLLIFIVYKRFYTGVVFSKNFAVTLIGVCVLTCMVTLAISTNIVISLGMVGALSIVRFRTAIKDPLDLLFLFWAISSGITAGAGMYLLTLATFVIMILILVIFYARKTSGMVYVAVIHYSGTEAGEEILKAFGKIRHFVKSKTIREENVELAVEVCVKHEDMAFEENIRNIKNVKDITIIQYNGEYNG